MEDVHRAISYKMVPLKPFFNSSLFPFPQAKWCSVMSTRLLHRLYAVMDSIACPGHQEEWRADTRPPGLPYLFPCPFLHLLGSVCNTIKKMGVRIKLQVSLYSHWVPESAQGRKKGSKWSPSPGHHILPKVLISPSAQVKQISRFQQEAMMIYGPIEPNFKQQN